MNGYPDAVRATVVHRILRRLAWDAPGAVDLAWLDAGADDRELSPSGPLATLPLPSALVLVATGLIETDIRFGSLFASLQQPLAARRPCIGLLAWLLSGSGSDRIDGPSSEATGSLDLQRETVVDAAHDLVRRGLLAVDNITDPRSEWVLRVPHAVWGVVESGRIDAGSLPPQLSVRSGFPDLGQVAVGPAAAPVVARLPEVVADGSLTAVLVRGLAGSGRTTVLGAVAARCGLEVLHYQGDVADPAWQLFGALASVADVLPVVACDPAPGETVHLPALPRLRRPLGVTCGRSGSLAGPHLERLLTVCLDPCSAPDRERLWRDTGLTATPDDLDDIVERFLLTPGGIVRASPLAMLGARAVGREHATADDVRAATRVLRRQELETLATRLDPLPVAATPVLDGDAAEEMRTLQLRCRHRERLAAALEGQDLGVRALFTGPSGTGKTMAARHLAGLLDLDLYRVDLAAVVNKYLGETERNLERVLARAEELDVLLLLDEGDALLSRRTDVGNANDRYANLETNYLLQRLETFDGIVVVTSNAAGRIDPAFLRRMDVTVEFVPPDAEQRWLIWSSHLAGDHEVAEDVLADVARRCQLTGGQIRNAALHATLLALDAGTPVATFELLEGVRREYRRAGATCPLDGQLVAALVPVRSPDGPVLPSR